MTALYEMTDSIKQLQEAVNDVESDNMALAISDTLDAMGLDFNEKAVNIVKFSHALDGDTKEIDAEIKRLQERKKTIQNKSNNIKEYLRYNMEASGIKKIECPLFSISLAKGQEVVIITDENLLPDEYVRVKTEISPNKIALKNALKDGKEVPGAELVTGKTSLRIK